VGTKIEASGFTTGRWLDRSSALKLADRAGRQLLEAAGRRPEDVDLLVNAGIYRDRNLGEPALAPLIQEDIGVNPEDPSQGHQSSFSLDVANGACGALTALQVVQGFIDAGTIATALVVASDADPGHHMARGFPFAPAGGALLCTRGEEGRGLAGFRWENSDDGGASFRATLGQHDGANALSIHREPTFAKQVGILASRVARRVLTDNGRPPVDLLIAAPAYPDFVFVLADELGVPVDRIVVRGPQFHTVAFLTALDAAMRSGALEEAESVLFVCGSAGLTAGAALYRP
jgi:3-oxoacyl-[acyl-carrier-protein] synthase-3